MAPLINHNPWIGCDLDGTLAEWHNWVKWNNIGKPIPSMVERIRQHLANGEDVRIYTARISGDPSKQSVCRASGELFTDEDMVKAIQLWTQEHLGRRLPVTCQKDYMMVFAYDDRAVQVESNTGRLVQEMQEKAAEGGAAQGPEFG